MMKAVGLGPMPHGRSGRRAGAVAALGALIVVFALVCVAGQCAMVVVSGDVVQANPEFAPSRWVYTVAGILGVACVEAAMVPRWNLLTLVDRLDVFSGRAVRWVDAIIACAAVEAALVLFVTLYGGLAPAETATRRRVPMWMSRWGLRAWSCWARSACCCSRRSCC